MGEGGSVAWVELCNKITKNKIELLYFQNPMIFVLFCCCIIVVFYNCVILAFIQDLVFSVKFQFKHLTFDTLPSVRFW